MEDIISCLEKVNTAYKNVTIFITIQDEFSINAHQPKSLIKYLWKAPKRYFGNIYEAE